MNSNIYELLLLRSIYELVILSVCIKEKTTIFTTHHQYQETTTEGSLIALSGMLASYLTFRR